MDRDKARRVVDTMRDGVDAAHEALGLFDDVMTRMRGNQDGPQMQWWQILGLKKDSSSKEIEKRWRELANIYHPDKGADGEMMKMMNWARDEGMGQCQR